MGYKQENPKITLDPLWNEPEDREYFIKRVSDLAFGDKTIERGFTMAEVLNRLDLFCEFTAVNEASFEDFSGD